jgi:hypothetical protein
MWATGTELLRYEYTSSHIIVNGIEVLSYVYTSSHVIVNDLELLRFVYTFSRIIVNDLESLRCVYTSSPIILNHLAFLSCVYILWDYFKICRNSALLRFRRPFLWITAKNTDYNTSNKLSPLSSNGVSNFHHTNVVYGSL